MPRARQANVAAQQMGDPPDLDEDEQVRQRVTRGELVRLPPGEAPVRDHVVAELRARIAAPKPPLAKKAAGA